MLFYPKYHVAPLLSVFPPQTLSPLRSDKPPPECWTLCWLSNQSCHGKYGLKFFIVLFYLFQLSSALLTCSMYVQLGQPCFYKSRKVLLTAGYHPPHSGLEKACTSSWVPLSHSFCASPTSPHKWKKKEDHRSYPEATENLFSQSERFSTVASPQGP